MNFEGKCSIKLKQGNQNTVEPLLSSHLYLAAHGQNPANNCQLYTAIKTSIQWPPLLSGHSWLLAVPRVIQFCVIPLFSGQWSRLLEWLLNRGLSVIYRKTLDFVFVESVCKTSGVNKDINSQLFNRAAVGVRG